MKTIRSEYVHKRIMKKVYKIIFSFVVVAILVLTVPGSYLNVYAAPLEDCDLDGYDDATGVPVPWPGYDETKGDTPEGPAGSTTLTPEPDSTDSTTDGDSNSETSGKTSGNDSDETNSVKSGNSNDADSTKTNSTKSENTKSENTKDENTDKTGTGNSGKTTDTVQDKTGKEESSKTSSATSGKTSSATADNTSKEESGKTGSTVNDNTREESDKISSSISNEGNSIEANTSSSVSDEENIPAETSQNENEQIEIISDNGSTEDSNIAVAEIESVINTKGSLEITEATGSIIHAGSSVIISGSGFAGDINNLEIVIQSEPRKLGIVESSENGLFEAKLNIPEDLEAGVHHIVVLYQGKEITRQQIEVGPKAADSFLQALSVGFTKDNKGLIPGLSILFGLFLAGIGALGINVLIRPRRKKS